MRSCLVLIGTCLFCCAVHAPAQSVDGQSSTANAELKRLDAALAAEPRSVDLLARRARLHAALGQPAKAIADYDRLLANDPKNADTYDARGSELFKLGQIEASIEDFDRAVELDPKREPWHWKRGISYYYAERWDEGRRQFEGYQSVDDNDVENAVWRFLCMARKDGLAAARGDLLKIRRDRRVPMMEIYGLFAGELQPQDVLAAVRAGEPSPEELNARQFYAHLYLGLYHEVCGDEALAQKHLKIAREHKIGHYMWNVANVHVQRLAGEASAAK